MEKESSNLFVSLGGKSQVIEGVQFPGDDPMVNTLSRV